MSLPPPVPVAVNQLSCVPLEKTIQAVRSRAVRRADIRSLKNYLQNLLALLLCV